MRFTLNVLGRLFQRSLVTLNRNLLHILLNPYLLERAEMLILWKQLDIGFRIQRI
jgi:hypothetical protein